MFWTVVLEKTLKSPLDSKEIKPVNHKGNQPWIFIGSIDAEVPIIWQTDAKCQLIEKDPDVRKDWRQEEKSMTEDEMIGWHHWLSDHVDHSLVQLSETVSHAIQATQDGCVMVESSDNVVHGEDISIHFSILA